VSTERATQVFYISDAPFAIPTLVSIESLRGWPSGRDLPINVVLLDMDERQIDDFASIARDLRIQIHSLSTGVLASLGNERFNRTHVPLATLARFLISDFFRDDADQILYVDGDTLFVQDPKELLELTAPARGLLAAEDQSSFYVNDVGKTGENIRSYFSNIGVRPEHGYFNAGVLKFRAGEWKRISRDCLLFLEKNLRICQYHDQSALNAVVGRDRVRISPIWNYKPSYRNWNLGAAVEPKLLHFVGGEKPWMGQLRVWSDLYPDYAKSVERRRHRSFPLRTWSKEEQSARLRAERLQAIKANTILLHRKFYRRLLFSRLVSTSAI
jgi:lipopolysaccharide biosynthesis glycosyltransferase